MKKSDQELLKQIDEIIEDNLSNPNFQLSDITEILEISRTKLYRKIVKLTDTLPNQYIREKRLKKAKEMLEIGTYAMVKEIALATGFRNHSYFSKLFYDEFQIMPYNLLKEE